MAIKEDFKEQKALQ